MALYNMPEGSERDYARHLNTVDSAERVVEIRDEMRSLAEQLRSKGNELAELAPDDVSTALLDAVYEVETLLEV